MAPVLDADESRKEYEVLMGQELGETYSALWSQCAWAHLRWQQFVHLYATNPKRLELLNQASPLFALVIQHDLLDQTLLSVCRLTDPVGGKRKRKLTILRLPRMLSSLVDKSVVAQVTKRVDRAVARCKFARDLRNRQLAHTNLALALAKTGAKPLPEATRRDVERAMVSIAVVLIRVLRAFGRDTRFDVQLEASNAVDLLYVIREGLQSRERRHARLLAGRPEPHDLEPPEPL